MRNRYLYHITLLIFFASFAYRGIAQFDYVYPLPGSKNHLTQTNIILRNGAPVDPFSINDAHLVDIVGSQSGHHSWKTILSEGETIIIKPVEPFAYDETVQVTVHDVLRKMDGSTIKGVFFSFQIMKELTAEQKEQIAQSDREMNDEDLIGRNVTASRLSPTGYLDSMATFKINVNNNAAPGQIFYDNQSDDESDTNSFPTIINNDGSIVWARDAGKNGHDFKINKNGYLTYFDYDSVQWIEIDSNYSRIDSFHSIGYGTNAHDMLIFPNKHIFIMGYDNEIMDLSKRIPGGQPNAQVKGLTLQELDSNKNVIFEWRSLDYFKVTDADVNTPLTNLLVDFEHPNAIELDLDGNMFLSSRNMCEITKINLTTGEIMWRMGGKNNQFTFVNDNIPEHFSYQHDIRRIPNGNITLFNNGAYLPIQRSSAKEYSLDETKKIATLVWYYEHPDTNPVFGRASGSVQRLLNGNTFIDWGNILFNVGMPNMTEVDANKNITWELTFDSALQKSYRAHKYDWNICSRITSYTMRSNSDSLETTLVWGTATGAKSYEVEFRPVGSVQWQSKLVPSTKTTLSGLKTATAYEWRIVTICSDTPLIQSICSRSDTFTTPVATSVDPLINSEESVRVYPSPTSGQITIEMYQLDHPSLSIFSSIGKVMYKTLNQYGEDRRKQIDVQSWPSDVYMIRITDGYGTVIKKFIRE